MVELGSGIVGVTNLGNVKIARQKTPVDVGAVANIRVVTVGGCFLQHLLHQTLVAARVFEE